MLAIKWRIRIWVVSQNRLRTLDLTVKKTYIHTLHTQKLNTSVTLASVDSRVTDCYEMTCVPTESPSRFCKYNETAFQYFQSCVVISRTNKWKLGRKIVRRFSRYSCHYKQRPRLTYKPENNYGPLPQIKQLNNIIVYLPENSTIIKQLITK